MTSPKLRFKEFDGDWNTVSLRHCNESIDSGWSPQCESFPANSAQWGVLKTTSVDWDGFKENANKKLPEALEPRPEIEVKPYDILVTRAGPTERVGVVSVVPNSVRDKLLISDKLIRIKSDKNNNPNFLGISLSSSKCQNQLQSKTSGLAKSQTNISQKILLDVALQTPCREEQTKIASFLSTVDEKISQLIQKHELLNQYKQGMMQKLFSQQIRFKEDDGIEFGEWGSTCIGDVCKITTGNKDTQNKVDDGIYPFFVRSQTVERINSFSMDTEAILTSGDGVGVGKNFHYIDGKFDFHQRVYCLYGFSEKMIGKYLYIYFSNYFYGRVKRLSAKNSVDSVRMDMISKMEIKSPCIEEQTKIANFLTTIDQKIAGVAQQIEQAKQWKKGLLQKMFV